MQRSLNIARRRVLTALAVAPLALLSTRASSAKNGFSVSVRAYPDLMPVRQKYGIPDKFGTCHTALVEGYAIEGHVPAADIHRLLKSKLKVAGLAVPGMPAGSPGMEGPRSEPYDVLSFDRGGAVQVFAHYR